MGESSRTGWWYGPSTLSGVLSGAEPEPARHVVASRALLAVEEWVFPLHEELVLAENAD